MQTKPYDFLEAIRQEIANSRAELGLTKSTLMDDLKIAAGFAFQYGRVAEFSIFDTFTAADAASLAASRRLELIRWADYACRNAHAL